MKKTIMHEFIVKDRPINKICIFVSICLAALFIFSFTFSLHVYAADSGKVKSFFVTVLSDITSKNITKERVTDTVAAHMKYIDFENTYVTENDLFVAYEEIKVDGNEPGVFSLFYIEPVGAPSPARHLPNYIRIYIINDNGVTHVDDYLRFYDPYFSQPIGVKSDCTIAYVGSKRMPEEPFIMASTHWYLHGINPYRPNPLPYNAVPISINCPETIDKNIKFIGVFYDENRQITRVDVNDVSKMNFGRFCLGEGPDGIAPCKYYEIDWPREKYAKFFLWDNMESMQPLCESREFEIYEYKNKQGEVTGFDFQTTIE